MTDQQLIDALVRLDRPVSPSSEFRDSLFMHLRREVEPRRPSWALVLAAAALLVAAMAGTALVAGVLQPDRAPAPLYRVEIPSGVTPLSSPGEVEAAVLSLALPDRPTGVTVMTWVPARTEFALPEGDAIEAGTPLWAVQAATDGSRDLLVLLEDGSLDLITHSYTASVEPTPEQPVTAGPPVTDPSAPLILTAVDGRDILATVINVPEPEKLPGLGLFSPDGNEVWVSVGFIYSDSPGYFLRVDTTTNDVTRAELPPQASPSYPPTAGTVIGQDEFGLWVSRQYGIALADPETGGTVREFDTREPEGHAYRRIARLPAFGSLWDYDRSSGVVYRIDPRTGRDVAAIPLGDIVDHARCGPDDLLPVIGVDGLPDVLVASCVEGTPLIDPATNSLIGLVQGCGYSGVVIDGLWWCLRMPEPAAATWSDPGALEAVNPAGGRALETLTFSHAQTAGWSPLVVGDSLWFVIGQVPEPNRFYDEYQRVVRIPIAELGG